MRFQVLGWLGVLALAACGGEAGTPNAFSVPSSGETDILPTTISVEPSEKSSAPAPNTAESKRGAPYPVVLVHGMAGFNKIEVGPVEITYFNGVVEALANVGESAYVTVSPPFASSEVRAQSIAKQIDEILARTGKAKVNIVAHSQGGLDARVLASPNGLGYGDRIASVTTVSTPHHGSKVADAVLGLLKYLPAKQIEELTNALLGLVQKTAYELQTDPHVREQITMLSEEYMTKVFNPKYTDDPNVVYKSYAGRSNWRAGLIPCYGSVYPNEPTKLDQLQMPLLPTAMFLEGGGLTVNDGLVTIESAKWGTFEQCVPADHLKEIGLFGQAAQSFNHIELYRNIVARLRSAGL